MGCVRRARKETTLAARCGRTLVMVAEPWIALAISFLGIVLIPLIILLWRIAVSSTKNQDKLASLEDDIRALVADKDKVHAKLYEQMREDRNATNQRLRWLEENVWHMQRQQP